MMARMLIIAAALVAGLATSVASAWLSAIWSTPTRNEFAAHPIGHVSWAIDSSRASRPCVVQQSDGFGIRYEAAWWRIDSIEFAAAILSEYIPRERTAADWANVKYAIETLAGRPEIVRQSSGLPFRCLSMRAAKQRGTVQPKRTGALKIRTGPDVFVPVSPIWPGLMANTLLYAIVFVAIQRMWMLSRRIRRIRRGGCPACAYPIGVSSVCTECGQELPTRTLPTRRMSEESRAS